MSIKQSVIAIGFLVTGLIISSLCLFDFMNPLKVFQKEIFNTNCLLLFAKFSTDSGDLLPQLPKICSVIQWTLAPSFLANGIIILLFGMKRVILFLSIFNLIGFMVIYCNPIIDSSFKCFCHFVEILICIFYFMRKMFVQESQIK